MKSRNLKNVEVMEWSVNGAEDLKETSFVDQYNNDNDDDAKGLKPPMISSVPATFVTTIVPDVHGKCSKMSWDENHLYFHEELIEIHKEYLLKNNSRVGIVLEGNSRFCDYCDYAIWHIDKTYQKTYGPRFGYDLYMSNFSSNFTLDNYSKCNRDYYEKPIRTTTDKFLIEDYEVFKIIKKTC
ncbi:hypothetical protein Glove_290g48 [Diversispora epigaea]|uniref:TLDc domain-containing protein n=1 Tax=Diversispora epigaea TaxID=1348612 RepID=A0A397I0H8_9GLOM|nr:hypothetical protein Glove_290g48 [Diversispora epigaea]